MMKKLAEYLMNIDGVYMDATIEQVGSKIKELPSTYEIIRKNKIANRIIFVGGLPGCGKSMMSPILGALQDVEIQKYNYSIEHVCSLYRLGRITEDATVAMIRMLTDLDLYNLSMTREINLRYKDLSSIFKNPKPWRYIKRIFMDGDAEALIRIKRDNPILQTLTHNLLIHGVPIVRAMKENFCLVEGVRHPLYMVRQWRLYIERYGNDDRDFTIVFNYNGHQLPFFTKGWEDLYIGSNSMDKVIYSISKSLGMAQSALDNMTPRERDGVVIVPFEQFVVNPWPYLEKITSLVGTKINNTTLKEMKRQNVPRDMIADGINRPIYRQYGWKPSKKGTTERDELQERRDFVKAEATSDALKVLDRLCEEYEDKYMTGILH